ncbi:hypothetical protein BBF96_04405 [Anoxybacter fermentans]|uniref:Transporter n=1 Tax=Anoxybacter fermentans TaxID=1323375 RepID=A0A3S9SWQ2_9FIRM|nr:TolC family protein [Anoxybacter fermentans]AZR72698.1 hypothetical protein BBF96_04405 [Anoxybacter fermentans]
MIKKGGYIFLFVVVFIALIQTSVLRAEEQLTLKQVLELALEQNEILKSSELDIKKANSELEIAWRSLWPKLNLQTSYTRLDKGPEIPKLGFDPVTKMPIFTYEEGSPDIYNTQITIQQPLFLGGKALIGIDLARMGVKLSEIQARQTAGDTLFRVIQAYFNVLMADEIVKTQENALKLIEEHERIVQVNYDAGMVLKTDLLKVKIEKRKAYQNLKSAQNNLYLAQRQLAQLLGLKNHDFKIVKSDLKPEIELDLESLYQKALLNRPELQALSLNQEMLKADLKMEKRSYWPNIMLVGSYTWKDSEFSLDDGSWNVMVSASMQLFDGGISKKKQDGIQLGIEKLEYSKENLIQMIKLELEEAMLKVKEAEDALVFQEMSLKNARENLRIANESYKVGVGSNIDVLNAQTTLKQAEMGLIQSQYQYQLNLFKILYKTGLLVDYCKEVVEDGK